MASLPDETSTGQTLKETVMKNLLIALALITAFAAPAAAETFPNAYMSR